MLKSNGGSFRLAKSTVPVAQPLRSAEGTKMSAEAVSQLTDREKAEAVPAGTTVGSVWNAGGGTWEEKNCRYVFPLPPLCLPLPPLRLTPATPVCL
jgi:hypothetical protein